MKIILPGKGFVSFVEKILINKAKEVNLMRTSH